jgi:hypothetical protein
VSRAGTFVAEGRMFQDISIGLIGMSYEPELCGIPVSAIGAELGKMVGSVGLRV